MNRNADTSLAGKAISFLLLMLVFWARLTFAGNPSPTETIDSVQAVLPDSLPLEGKVVYVDFWASWCAPCRLSFPWMQTMYNKFHRQGFEIVAVNVDKDHQAALDFLKEMKATFPIVFDSTGNLAKKHSLEAMPTSFIYNRDGHLISRQQGFHGEETDSLEYRLRQLLSKGKTE
jgi:thiol-disulfide isomerase/thioredoxin